MRKKHYIILLYAIPIIILFHSCEKKGYTTTATGIVIDSRTRQPIDGVVVFIQDGLGPAGLEWNKANARFFPKKVTAYTDSTGYFSLSLKDHENPPLLGAGRKGYDFGVLRMLHSGKNSDLVIEGKPSKYMIEGYLLKEFTFIALEKSDSVSICRRGYEDRIDFGDCSGYMIPSKPIEKVSFFVLENRYATFSIHFNRNNEWIYKTTYSVFVYDLKTPVDPMYY